MTAELTSVGVIRAAALQLLNGYEAARGVCGDEHDPAPRVHPMAEAKYMLACVELGEGRVLTPAGASVRIGASLDRLGETCVRPAPRTAAWGLGFSVYDLPSDEPFSVTTAMVLDALVRARPLLDGDALGTCEQFIQESVHWLLDGLDRIDEDGVRLPLYSPSMRRVANNAAAYWAGSLAKALPPTDGRRAEVEDVASAILGRNIPGIGWVYDEGSVRSDLLHTCYIGLGLLSALTERRAEVESALLCAVSQFSGAPWSDNFDVHEVDDVLSGAVRGGARWARIVSGKALLGFDRRARAWSMGELLVVLANLAKDQRLADFCHAQLRALAPVVAEQHLPEKRFRHSMHVAHGLSCAVRAAREKNQPITS